MSWAWWDWPLTWLTNHRPSVLWHCSLGYLTRKIVSQMTYNVSSGTLNTTILYYTSYRSSIDSIALNCLVFEKIAFFAFWRQTDRQTDRQMDKQMGHHRCVKPQSRYGELRLTNEGWTWNTVALVWDEDVKFTDRRRCLPVAPVSHHLGVKTNSALVVQWPCRDDRVLSDDCAGYRSSSVVALGWR